MPAGRPQKYKTPEVMDKVRNAKLYKGTKYEGRMMRVSKECAVLGRDDEGDYMDVYKPNHVDYEGNVICFYDRTER